MSSLFKVTVSLRDVCSLNLTDCLFGQDIYFGKLTEKLKQ